MFAHLIYSIYANIIINQMQVDELTPNGIENLLDGKPAYLQVIDFKIIERDQLKQKFILSQLSDGYTSISRCLFTQQHFPDLEPLYKIVRVRLKDLDADAKQKFLQNKGKKSKIYSVDNSKDIYKIAYSHLKAKIGEPIDFKTFYSKNKQNPKGNRQIPLPKKANRNISKKIEQNSDDELDTAIQQLKNKSKKLKKQEDHENSKSFQNSKNHTSSTSMNPRAPRNKSKKPIQKIPEQRKSIKPQISHLSQQHTKIRELFLGIQNFSLCVRTLFVFPMRTYTSKKGNQSQLMNIEFGDSSGTIMCTIFGQSIAKFSNISVDQIYIIQGASVSENTYRGNKQMKLSFNDKITVLRKIKQNQANIPDISHFGISLKQLTEADVGRTYTVLCYVKQNPKEDFITKKGANMMKKILRLFDLQNHIETQIVLFNQNADIEYSQGMHLMRGVQKQEYQGRKQYKGGYTFLSRKINMPKIKKIRNIEQLNFVNVSSNQKTKKTTVNSFLQLHQKCAEIEDKESVWSEVVCYLKGVRHGGNSKTTYISCPQCKKKVQQQDNQCIHCHATFDHPQPRYILNVNLVDDHSNIWASSYDDTGSLILAEPDEQNFPAERFVMLNQEALRNKVNALRYKRMKLKIVSNFQEYNGQKRLKHKVHKVIPFSATQQCSNMLSKIKKMMEGM